MYEQWGLKGHYAGLGYTVYTDSRERSSLTDFKFLNKLHKHTLFIQMTE